MLSFDILRARMAKRGLSLRSLELGKIEDAAKGSVRQMLTIKQGISKENAKENYRCDKSYKIKS